MPVDADTIDPEYAMTAPQFFNPREMTSHFATCPDAAKFRRAKPGAAAREKGAE